ncbi:MAG: hypothetical protein HOP15_05665 [Planctomycetes bacterium]|nr:hypothetical protein [Planctomycetota bacterium]
MGEDGGVPAPPAIDGRTVAVLETTAANPALNEWVLRGTIPVPPRTFPRSDGRDPFVILDWDGTALPTQTELVSRYANDADGADVVEVIAKVSRDPAVTGGDALRFEVVHAPHLSPPGPGSIGIEDLMTTSGVPANIQALLNDPNGIEIALYDCFGNRYVCRPLDGSGSMRLERRGRVTTELRVYQTMRPEPFVNGAAGTLPHALGVHAYLTTSAGEEILGLALRFNNGSTGRDTTSALDDPLDKFYFQKIELTLPANLVLIQDFDDPYLGSYVSAGQRWVWDLVEPMANGKLHVMRWLSQFHRRLWIASGAGSGFAGNYADGVGNAFCVRGTDPIFGHDYWSWWNKGTARFFPQKYQLPSLDHVGLGGLRNQLYNQLGQIRERLLNGTSDGNYPIASGVLGWGHPYGVSYGGMTSGNEIFCWDGITTAASASYFGLHMFRALHRMHSDRQPNVLIDADGEPSTVERWWRENGALDYVPFAHYVVPFLGGSYPDPFGFANAPRFQINHVQANGLAPAYEVSHLAFDPHDYQHLIRYTRSAKVLAWLGNDSLAKDDLRQQAEMFHLSYHTWRNDVYGGFMGSGLLCHRAVANANPGKGGPFGRGEAWGLDCAVAAYSLADPGWRAVKKPWLEDIVEMLLTSQGACNGFLQAIVSNKAVEGRYRARQQIEQSITENALQGLRESVFKGADPGYSAMTRDVLVDSLYGFISEMAWAPGAGPYRYTGIGPLDISQPVWCSRAQMPSDALTTGDIETFQDWSSFAYGFEITGDPIFLERALTQFFNGTDLLLHLRNEGTNNIENRSALLALMQHESGLL